MAWNPGISWNNIQNTGVTPVGGNQAGFGALNSDQQAYYQHQQSMQWQIYQKQLSQWQSQYGEQYAMQMQSSNNAPPPPPPEPAEKPPEPPNDSPNKNNQPHNNSKNNPHNQSWNLSNRGGNQANRGRANQGMRNFQDDNTSVKSNNSGNSGKNRGGIRGGGNNQNQQQNDQTSNNFDQDWQMNNNRGSRGGNNNNLRGRGANNNKRNNQRSDQEEIPSLMGLYNKGTYGESNLLRLKKQDSNQQPSQQQNQTNTNQNQDWITNNRGSNNNQRGRGGNNNNNFQQNDHGNNSNSSNNWQGGNRVFNPNTSNNSNQGGFNQGQQTNNQNRQGNKRSNSGERSNNSNDNWIGNREQNSRGWNQNFNNSANWHDIQGNWNNNAQSFKANDPLAHNWNEKSPQIPPDKIPPGWSEKPADVPKADFDPYAPSTSSIVIPEQKKTDEEILFDEQFKKWEESFLTWKAANVNHPDKASYRDYEMKFEEMKEKLLMRKKAMNKKKEEEALELMKKKMEAEAIIQQVEASRVPKIQGQSVQVIAPVDSKMDFNIKNMEAHNSVKTNTKKSNTSAIQGWLSKSSSGIPGLDLVPEKEKKISDEKLDDEVTEVINLVDDKPSIYHNKPIKIRDDNLPSSSKKPRIEILEDVIISKDDPMDLESPETEDLVASALPTNLSSDITQGLSHILSNPGLMALIASVSNQKGGDSQPGTSGNNLCKTDSLQQNTQKLGGARMRNQGNWNPQGNNSKNTNNMMMQNIPSNQRINQQFGNMNQNQNQFQDETNRDNDYQQQDYDDEYPDEDPFQDQYEDDYNEDNNIRDQNYNQNSSNNQPQIRSLLNMNQFGNQGLQQNQQNPQNYQQNFQQNQMNPPVRFNQGPGNIGNIGPPQGNNQMNQMNENVDPNELHQYRMQNRMDPFFRPNQVIDYGNQKFPIVHDEKDLFKPSKVVEYGHRSSGLFNSYEFNPVVPDFCPARKIDYLHKNSSGVAPSKPWSKDDLKLKTPKDTKYKNMALSKDTESRPDYPSKFVLINAERPPTTNRRVKKLTPKIKRIKVEIAEKLRKAQEGTEHLEDISSSESEIENEPEVENQFRHSQPAVRIVLPSLRAQNNQQAPPKQIFNISIGENVKALPKVIMDINNILALPGRKTRPKKLVIILRGIPGSGKSHLARLIKERELAEGGSAPRILSIDDYFMSEVDETKKCEKTGRNLSVRKIVYEFDAGSEDNYMHYLVKSFKKNLMDGLFNFIIVDCNCDSLNHYNMFSEAARAQGFSIFAIELEDNAEICHKRNIHNRSLEDIEAVLKKFNKTPEDQQLLDATSILVVKKEEPKADAGEDVKPPDVKMDTEDISDEEVEADDMPDGFEVLDEIGEEDTEEEEIPKFDMFKTQSKWETTSTEESKARLDGISKPFKHDSIEDYLQMDGWEPTPSAKPGKKRVRWADIEEKREQEKMRAIGFVIGQDWNRVMDPTDGRSALTKTKYIERTRKN